MATKINVPGYFNWDNRLRKVVKYKDRDWDVPARATDDELREAIDQYLAGEALESLISFVFVGSVVLINSTFSTVKNLIFERKVKRYQKRPSKQQTRVGEFKMNLGK